MSREAHVRFCEGLGVKFPWPTHPTGGIDHLASRMTAYLVPNGYAPPLMSGGPALPPELQVNALASVEALR